MFEKFTTEGGDTFRRRYEGTYGYFIDRTTNAKPLLVQLVSFEGRNGEIVNFQRLDGVSFRLNANTEKDIGFEFTPPEKRWYPHPKYGAVLGARRTARQFSRGLCDNNYTLHYWYQKGNRLEYMSLSFQEVHNILESSETVKLSFNDWAKKIVDTSYYLSPQFALVHVTYPDRHISLRLFDREIAKVSFHGDNKITFVLSDKIFKGECEIVAKLIGVSEATYE